MWPRKRKSCLWLAGQVGPYECACSPAALFLTLKADMPTRASSSACCICQSCHGGLPASSASRGRPDTRPLCTRREAWPEGIRPGVCKCMCTCTCPPLCAWVWRVSHTHRLRRPWAACQVCVAGEAGLCSSAAQTGASENCGCLPRPRQSCAEQI